MESNEPKRLILALTNPNKKWVAKELDALIEEWRAWQEQVRSIPVPRATRITQRGTTFWLMVKKISKSTTFYRKKTLTFLDNNLEGHGFIYGRDGTKIDRTDLRLDIRVKHRVNDLEVLRACIQYAKVPEAYWKATAKEMLEKVAGKGPELATEIAAKYLQGIM